MSQDNILVLRKPLLSIDQLPVEDVHIIVLRTGIRKTSSL